MTENYVQQLEQRINDMECQLAFQEQSIEELNAALSQQQLLISKMQEQMKFMVGKLKTMDTSQLADPSEETPPPHY
ncbi:MULTISPECIES: SlyX family protein [Vibrio]|uniref:Protein SlyX homolog n=1 Tax=Vibrio proteolyticus NBRC 13287 TaxID=1219065 RepID=U3BSH3_VIBPR|nr:MULTISPECIES: SlyX family protein [Vibrio]NAW57316.1 SlyX protein [Vibrio sp. V36_P2S2PM302]NAX20410.1 SlyX protein [Vibrio sp. V39_P1S14PM300]NAX27919.1 SlyX protein [Vibrio sp. V38_P2S17PM301]NAX30873.1 SlyX protein [Vibrio sp. V37_P2S8PM304]GAD69428.1 protein SlyX homolog [Vibrio proteolyticus NBRC 13287]